MGSKVRRYEGRVGSASVTEKEGQGFTSHSAVSVLERHSLQQCCGGGPARPVEDDPDRDSWPCLLLSHDERGVGHDGGSHDTVR